MAIVVDANLLIVLINGDPRGEAVLVQMTDWLDRNVPLHAPDLTPYEVANALTRSITVGTFLRSELEAAWQLFLSLPNYLPSLHSRCQNNRNCTLFRTKKCL